MRVGSNNLGTNAKTVLVFIEQFLGRTMTFVENQIRLLEEYYDVVVVTNKRSNEQLFQRKRIKIIPLTIPSRAVGYALRRMNLAYCTASTSMRRTIEGIHEAQPIAFAVSHFGTAGLQIAPVLRKLQIPHGIIIHGVDGSTMLESPGYRRQLTSEKWARLIFASESLHLRYKQVGPAFQQTRTIHLGINIREQKYYDRISPAEKFRQGKTLRFIQASNFVEKKGHYFTVKAFARLIKHYPNCELILCGDGPLKQRTQDLVEQMGISERVTFTGHLSQRQIEVELRKSDVFLHHSITDRNGGTESVPTVIMEAMSHGMPVISTFHAGIPELIQNGENGILVAEKDEDQYVRALIDSLTLNETIGEEARNTIRDRFDASRNLKLIIEYITAVKNSPS
jgi:glycosyltransferase involved in cell wall biosynthesis